ncbi:MAG: hypothetical protein NZM04_00470 [Methylacidiphilales bacterium]|nr:hypothetical protein [Candidatus Methylacidiphilales bacterium]
MDEWVFGVRVDRYTPEQICHETRWDVEWDEQKQERLQACHEALRQAGIEILPWDLIFACAEDDPKNADIYLARYTQAHRNRQAKALWLATDAQGDRYAQIDAYLLPGSGHFNWGYRGGGPANLVDTVCTALFFPHSRPRARETLWTIVENLPLQQDFIEIPIPSLLQWIETFPHSKKLILDYIRAPKWEFVYE